MAKKKAVAAKTTEKAASKASSNGVLMQQRTSFTPPANRALKIVVRMSAKTPRTAWVEKVEFDHPLTQALMMRGSLRIGVVCDADGNFKPILYYDLNSQFGVAAVSVHSAVDVGNYGNASIVPCTPVGGAIEWTVLDENAVIAGTVVASSGPPPKPAPEDMTDDVGEAEDDAVDADDDEPADEDVDAGDDEDADDEDADDADAEDAAEDDVDAEADDADDEDAGDDDDEDAGEAEDDDDGDAEDDEPLDDLQQQCMDASEETLISWAKQTGVKKYKDMDEDTLRQAVYDALAAIQGEDDDDADEEPAPAPAPVPKASAKKATAPAKAAAPAGKLRKK